MKKVTKNSVNNEFRNQFNAQLDAMDLTKLDASDIAGFYGLFAVLNVKLPEELINREFGNVILDLTCISFLEAQEHEEEIQKLSKKEFELDILPVLLEQAREIYPADDVYTLYLYRWALTKGFELAKLVGDDVNEMYNKLKSLDFLDEEILGSEDEVFDLSKSLPEGEDAENLFNEMLENFGKALELLLTFTGMDEELALYEENKEACTLIFSLGKMVGNMTRGEIDMHDMLFGTEKGSEKLVEILSKLPLVPEYKEFVNKNREACSRILGIGIYFENIALEENKADFVDFEAMEDYCRTGNPLAASLLVG